MKNLTLQNSSTKSKHTYFVPCSITIQKQLQHWHCPTSDHAWWHWLLLAQFHTPLSSTSHMQWQITDTLHTAWHFTSICYSLVGWQMHSLSMQTVSQALTLVLTLLINTKTSEDQALTLLRRYAVSVGSWLPAFQYGLSTPSSSVKQPKKNARLQVNLLLYMGCCGL